MITSDGTNRGVGKPKLSGNFDLGTNGGKDGLPQFWGHLSSTATILPLCNGLQMIWSDTTGDTAKVVNLQTIRYWAFRPFIGDSVCHT